MYEVGKCFQHSESESLPLLCNYRDPKWSRSHLLEIKKKSKIGDSDVIAATIDTLWSDIVCYNSNSSSKVSSRSDMFHSSKLIISLIRRNEYTMFKNNLFTDTFSN